MANRSRSQHASTQLASGDCLEIVVAVGAAEIRVSFCLSSLNLWNHSHRPENPMPPACWLTGKYKDFEQTRLAVEASGAEIVTVAIRRHQHRTRRQPASLLDRCAVEIHLSAQPAGSTRPTNAIRTLPPRARTAGWACASEAEVLGDAESLYPNVAETSRPPKCW